VVQASIGSDVFPYVFGTGDDSTVDSDVEIEAVIVKSDLSQVIAAVVTNEPSYFGAGSSTTTLMRGLVIMSTSEHATLYKNVIESNTDYPYLRANAMALKDDSSQSQVAVVYSQDLCSANCGAVRIVLRVYDLSKGALVTSIPMND